MPAGETPGRGCSAAELEPRVGLLERDGAEARHRIDPARRQEHEIGAVAAGELEAVVGAQRGSIARRNRGCRRTRRARMARPSTRQRVGVAGAQQVVEARGCPRARTPPRRRAAAEGSARRPGGGGCRARRCSQSGWRSASPIATLAPMNPAPPVTSTRISRGDYACRAGSAARRVPCRGCIVRLQRRALAAHTAGRPGPDRADRPRRCSRLLPRDLSAGPAPRARDR